METTTEDGSAPDGSVRRPRRRNRRRLAVALTAGAIVLLAATVAEAAGIRSFLSISPDHGSRGDRYEVTVRCDENPGLSVRVLDGEKPPSTTPPLPTGGPDGVANPEPGTWVYRTKADAYDRTYWAQCGELYQRADFDVDLPRLYLGPVPGPIDWNPPPRTKVLGTDCPPGATPQVRIVASGRTVTGKGRLDANHDWAFDLPSPAGTGDQFVTATCGSVTYPPLVVPALPIYTSPTEQASIIRLYRAYFRRDPEGAGLLGWVRAHQAGRTLGTISEHFTRSPEFARRYGQLSDGAFVDQMFRNLFDRAPDAAGRAHWVSVLGSGRSRGVVVLGLSESAEFRRITGTV